jgi:hypothetical protein
LQPSVSLPFAFCKGVYFFRPLRNGVGFIFFSIKCFLLGTILMRFISDQSCDTSIQREVVFTPYTLWKGRMKGESINGFKRREEKRKFARDSRLKQNPPPHSAFTTPSVRMQHTSFV